MIILVLTNSFSGLHSFRKEVMQALIDAGHQVVISAPIDEKSSYFEEMGCKVLDTIFDRKGTNPLSDFKLMMHYRQMIRKEGPNVVLTYTIKPNLYGGIACQLCGVPQIANVTGLGSAVENPGWLQKLTIFLYRVGLRKAHTVFFQNKSNMDFCLIHRMVRGQKRLIPGSGVNLLYHTFQEYPGLDEPIRFIFVGRLLREKGIDDYLTAAREIKAKYPLTEFHVLGGCEEAYEERMRKLEDEGIVIYHGSQPDVRPFIGRSWCTVHPSYYPEGMSNVLLESCAAGRPIITTNRPGCGEIVDNGINGFIVRPKDGYDVARKIEVFINLPYEKKREMGVSARKKVEQEFDRNIVIEAYLKEINSIVAHV